MQTRSPKIPKKKILAEGNLFSEAPLPQTNPKTLPQAPLINPIPPSAPADKPSLASLSVDELIVHIDQTLSQKIGIVRVCGEISGFTAYPSGHWYFQLKGQAHLIKCVMFRPQTLAVAIKPQQGLMVEATAMVSLYRPKGELQLQIKSLKPAGMGALYVAFVALRDRLANEGLFAEARKKPLPRFPRTIGIISSLSAAGLQDVLTILRLHSPHLSIIIYPSLVQGANASADLVRATQTAIADARAEVLMLVRGGGSMEDLWCFNDETLIREIAQCPIPTIAGIGHETDNTLIDFVADVRAPTPTAAAHLLPKTKTANEALQQSWSILRTAFYQQFNTAKQKQDFAWSALKSLRESFGRPTLIIHQQRLFNVWQRQFLPRANDLSHRQRRLILLFHQQLEKEKQRLAHWGDLLTAHNPALPQQRGFALITNAEGLIQSAKTLALGQKIHIEFKDGGIYANVTGIADGH